MDRGPAAVTITPQLLSAGALNYLAAALGYPARLSRVALSLTVASAQRFRVSVLKASGLEEMLLDDTPAAATSSYIWGPASDILLLPTDRVRVQLANAGTPASTVSGEITVAS